MPSGIKSINDYARKGRDFLLDVIFPIECLGCGQEGVWLCRKCFSKLEFKDKQYCLRCKKENKYGQFCPACGHDYHLDGVLIAGDYEKQLIARLIKSLKYHFARDVAEILGDYLSLFLRNLINENRISGADIRNGQIWRRVGNVKNAPRFLFDLDNTVIMPVPLHKKRLRWRGFNQAEAIAKIISDRFNLELSTNNLIRIKHKKPQAKLGEARRQDNIKDCFFSQDKNMKGRHVILIDDVTTTGSTLNECAKALKANGAGEIWGLVVAKG